MKTHLSSLCFLMAWWLCMLNFCHNGQAQYINSSNNTTLRVANFRFLRFDSNTVQVGVLYSLTDSSVVIVDRKELLSFIENWKPIHGGLLPPVDTLQKVLALHSIAYKNLQWVKLNKMPGGLAGLLIGGTTAALTVIMTGLAYGFEGAAIVAVLGFIPITVLGTIIGAVTMQRTVNNTGEAAFRKKIKRKWQRRTIHSQLDRMYPNG